MSQNVLLKASERPAWRVELANLVSDPDELCRILALRPDDADRVRRACAGFRLRVPLPYLSRIRKRAPNDPLLLQVMPQARELVETPGYSTDPLDESQFTPVTGLLHKYHGRVLVVLNGYCAIHCRYCFRRHFPYQAHQINAEQWRDIIAYIRQDPSIEEVILSGGDPLTSPDKVLSKYCADVADIPHVQRLRLHTRLPVVIPTRIDRDCLRWMSDTRLQVVMVLHINHAQEIDDDVAEALRKLSHAGVCLLNQSVLLRGVNDDVEVLAELSRALFANGTLPYYLHTLDAVQGAAHFDLDAARVHALQTALRGRLPGYLVPKFVVEEPHADAKTPL